MKNSLRAIKLFSLIISIGLVLGKDVYAKNEGITLDYVISYDIQENGNTKVTQIVKLTNLVNDTIPREYSFITKQLKVDNVEAVINGKEGNPKVERDEEETIVSVPIINHSIGEGRQNIIELSYETPDIATQVGEIWNIYIPKIDIPDTTSIYDVTLSVPESIGPKIYVSPSPDIENTVEGKRVYKFAKESFGDTGISASFGKHQVLNFKLKYQIENTSFLTTSYDIALPLDIKGVQQVSLDSINPKPIRISIDEDGNPIATFKVSPKNKLEIETRGSARISGRQINPEFGGKFEGLPKDLVSKYTREQKFWETNSSDIRTLANSLKDESLTVTQNAQKIYAYITTNMKYDFDILENNASVSRLGAKQAMNNKDNATCMEFSDVFIATARAMGIPAREINGYAFTSDETSKPISVRLNGGDVLHSWAEFYDPYYGWVQVDPTWGSTSNMDYFTKLDTNHFAFVIKGINSEYPYPAGAYRFDENERLVEVDFAQQTSSTFIPNLEVSKTISLNPIDWIRGINSYQVLNTGSVFIYDVQGKTLAPGQKTRVRLEKDRNTLDVKNFGGEKVEFKI